ncbi:hypothetical protein K1728_05505 [Weissella confusa]|uniref:hypothetical protein n=1 Tax=Weissella confusa TaxID=1583 RepID=UPI001C6FB110|nr:hypothetical protein [Weissella confusa]QYU58855.1 hypothetical protein K1728_05505 [Weissella confusa]
MKLGNVFYVVVSVLMVTIVALTIGLHNQNVTMENGSEKVKRSNAELTSLNKQVISKGVKTTIKRVSINDLSKCVADFSLMVANYQPTNSNLGSFEASLKPFATQNVINQISAQRHATVVVGTNTTPSYRVTSQGYRRAKTEGVYQYSVELTPSDNSQKLVYVLSVDARSEQVHNLIVVREVVNS